ncbi:hypothetical protein PALU110988_30265 [Paenibacillus lupini]
MYKEFTMDQLYLLMDLQDDIHESHLVRFFNDAIQSLRSESFHQSLSRRWPGQLSLQNAPEVTIYLLLLTERIHFVHRLGHCRLIRLEDSIRCFLLHRWYLIIAHTIHVLPNFVGLFGTIH